MWSDEIKNSSLQLLICLLLYLGTVPRLAQQFMCIIVRETFFPWLCIYTLVMCPYSMLFPCTPGSIGFAQNEASIHVPLSSHSPPLLRITICACVTVQTENLMGRVHMTWALRWPEHPHGVHVWPTCRWRWSIDQTPLGTWPSVEPKGATLNSLRVS